jgi:hypothetical protein
VPYISPLAVLVASVAGFVLGGLWYGPLFGKAWMAEVGFTEEALTQGFSPVRMYGTAFVAGAIGAYALAWILGPDASPVSGATTGLALGATIAATSFATNYAFERKSVTLLLINGGYHVAQFGVMGAVLGAMG